MQQSPATAVVHSQYDDRFIGLAEAYPASNALGARAFQQRVNRSQRPSMEWPESALQRASERGRDSTMSSTQRVAIITGASQGIGQGLVSAYRKLGYAVVANSRTIGESDDPMVVTVPGDIGQPGVGQRIVDAAMERFGRVDTVVNNAGIFIPKPFTDYTDEDYDAVTGVNLRGFFEVSRAAVAAMLSRDGGGHVVNISTSLVDHANSQVPSALASLTKGGLNAVTKALAVEYASRGIRSNAVALGVIRTPMHEPASFDTLAKLHPVGRLGEIDDVVDAVVYLENASFVTGEILHVDGGQSAGH
jgi:NAD(P)-dependent dehydrogenase (short-subunit alcohol dehydrogenase family)